MSRHNALALVFAGLLTAASPAAAQPLLPTGLTRSSSPTDVTQQLSVNPFGLMIDFFNIDYEKRATNSVTFGVGGSTAMTDTYDYDENYDYRSGVPYSPTMRRERYLNGDVYVRYYPAGAALDGLALGMKIGVTRVPDQGSYVGYGFDLNHSRILGDHFYLGYGFGLKRLVGVDKAAFDLEYVPTFRLNVGIGF